MSNFPLSLKNGPDQSLLSPIKPNGVYIYILKKSVMEAYFLLSLMMGRT